jgi:hypothetical protein
MIKYNYRELTLPSLNFTKNKEKFVKNQFVAFIIELKL